MNKLFVCLHVAEESLLRCWRQDVYERQGKSISGCKGDSVNNHLLPFNIRL